MSENECGEFYPVLLVKSTTLQLKYLLLANALILRVYRIDANILGYGIVVPDDEDDPSFLWSLYERAEELSALAAILSSKCLQVALFNELAVNVASSSVLLRIASDAQATTAALVNGSAAYVRPDPRAGIPNNLMVEPLRRMATGAYDGLDLVEIDSTDRPDWREMKSMYVTNRIKPSWLLVLSGNEGGQQEELGIWLIDSLQPDGAILNPQIEDRGRMRELTDVLMTYDNGVFLIESKALTVLNREALPSRGKLASDVAKHADKAVKQLTGAIRSIRREVPIYDMDGAELRFTRTIAPHVIVLIPDLDLLYGVTRFGGEHLAALCENVNAFFHFLDPVELLRVVQTASMVARQRGNVSVMDSFYDRLVRRIQIAIRHPDPAFNVLTRVE